MKLGIGSFAYMWAIGLQGARPPHPLTPQQLLEKAAKLGVRVVQFGPNLNVEQWTAADARQIGNDARSLGITPELGSRGTQLEDILRLVELARLMGATLLRTMPQTPQGDVPAPHVLIADLRKVTPHLAEHGVCLAIENAMIPAKQLRCVLEEVDSPFVGVTLDTVNSLAIPETVDELMAELAPFVLCVHLKDFAVERLWHKAGFLVEGRPAGKGLLDVSGLLNALADSPHRPNVILELWTPEQKTLPETVALEEEWVRESVAFLRQYIAA